MKNRLLDIATAIVIGLVLAVLLAWRG